MLEQTRTVKSDCSEYLEELLKDIELKKLKHKHTVYRINDRITDEVVNCIKEYFSSTDGYDLDIRRCKKTRNQWDVVIYF